MDHMSMSSSWASSDNSPAASSLSNTQPFPVNHPGVIPPGTVISGIWKVGELLGYGSYGVVQEATDENGEQTVVVKSERTNSSYLRREVEVYQAVHQNGRARGFPRIHLYETVENWDVLVIDRLGDTIKERGLESMTAVYTFMIRALEIFEHLHRSKFAHADVHSENFMYGLSGSSEQDSLFLIDFSCSLPIVGEDKELAALNNPTLSNKSVSADLSMLLEVVISVATPRLSPLPPYLHRYLSYCEGCVPEEELLPDYGALRAMMVRGRDEAALEED